jgi:hypothetical protein
LAKFTATPMGARTTRLRDSPTFGDETGALHNERRWRTASAIWPSFFRFPRARPPTEYQTRRPFFATFSRAAVDGWIGLSGIRPAAHSSSRNWPSSSLEFGALPRAAVKRSIIVCACASCQLFVALIEVSLIGLFFRMRRDWRSPQSTSLSIRPSLRPAYGLVGLDRALFDAHEAYATGDLSSGGECMPAATTCSSSAATSCSFPTSSVISVLALEAPMNRAPSSMTILS